MFSTIYLGLEEVPPFPRLGCWSLYRWRLRMQGPAQWKMIFSIAFMFGTIYLRLEGKVSPPPRNGNFFKHEYYRMFFSIAFMFSPIYLRLAGDVPHPPRIELGSHMSQVSEVNECILQSNPPPLPSLILCL